jgi:hypothetical protein
MAGNEYLDSVTTGKLPSRAGTEIAVAVPVLAAVAAIVILLGPSPVRLVLAAAAAIWFGVRIAMIVSRNRRR